MEFLKHRLSLCNSLSYGGPQVQRQKQFHHGKIIFVTTKSFSPRQNHFRHGKNNFVTAKSFFVTAKSFSQRQKQFRHGKIIFVTAKTILPRKNHFPHGKNNFTTAKSFSLRQNHLYSRDVNSQGVMGIDTTWRTTRGSFISDSSSGTWYNILKKRSIFCPIIGLSNKLCFYGKDIRLVLDSIFAWFFNAIYSTFGACFCII